MEDQSAIGLLDFQVPDSLPRDDIHAVLAHPIRRELIGILYELEVPERPSALARNIGVVMDCTDREAIDRIHQQLWHIHIPKMEDAGLVSADEDRNTVELTDDGRTLAEILIE